MWGAIIGDIVGSRFEWDNTKRKDFEFFSEKCFFTDDTVLTVAVAKALLDCKSALNEPDFKQRLVVNFKDYVKKYPDGGYGGNFIWWAMSNDSRPYGSYGNGSAMRVSPVAWYAQSLQEAETLAKWSAEVTHNHPEGIKGAVAIAGAIYLAKSGATKEEIFRYVADKGYALQAKVDEYAVYRKFDETCQGTVPRAVQCFYEGEGFEDTVRNAVYVGGDTDTNAAIAGSVAEAFFGINRDCVDTAKKFLDEELLSVAERFTKQYVNIKQ